MYQVGPMGNHDHRGHPGETEERTRFVLQVVVLI